MHSSLSSPSKNRINPKGGEAFKDENFSCHTNHYKPKKVLTIYSAARNIYFALKISPVKSKQDLIQTILRFDSSRSASELETLSDNELVVLKVRMQFEYERHNINLFRKGYSFHSAKKKKRSQKNNS